MRTLENIPSLSLKTSTIQDFRQLFEYLPDVYFFAKNREGRFIMANRLFAELCGVANESCLLGKTDRDFFPASRSSRYTRDDRQVMQTGQPLVNRVEPSPAPQGGTSLVLTTKVPLRDENGQIAGIAGITRDLSRAKLSLQAFDFFHKSLSHIDQHFREALEIPELARLEGMSVSQFERRFKQLFQMTPVAYILHARIRHACDQLIHTQRSMVDIALDCGFYDHSHFTRQFRRAMGVPPLRYRKTHQHAPSPTPPA